MVNLIHTRAEDGLFLYTPTLHIEGWITPDSAKESFVEMDLLFVMYRVNRKRKIRSRVRTMILIGF